MQCVIVSIEVLINVHIFISYIIDIKHQIYLLLLFPLFLSGPCAISTLLLFRLQQIMHCKSIITMVCFLVSVSSFTLRTFNFLPFLQSVHFPRHLRPGSSPLHPVSWPLSPAWSLPPFPWHPFPATCHLPLSTLLSIAFFLPFHSSPCPLLPFPLPPFPCSPCSLPNILVLPASYLLPPPACMMLMILLNPYNLNSLLLVSCIFL